MADLIDRQELLNAFKSDTVFKGDCLLEAEYLIMHAEPIDLNRGQRQFEKIIIENHNGRPYYHIQYKEKEKGHIGYSSYNIDIVSEFLRDYFMHTADVQKVLHGHWNRDHDGDLSCSVCKHFLYSAEYRWSDAIQERTPLCPWCGAVMDEVR